MGYLVTRNATDAEKLACQVSADSKVQHATAVKKRGYIVKACQLKKKNMLFGYIICKLKNENIKCQSHMCHLK